MMLLVTTTVTVIVLLIGYFWSKGQAKIPFRSKKSQVKSEDWGIAEHKWEISNKTGIYYCNVAYFSKK
jgi:hypothetical protein